MGTKNNSRNESTNIVLKSFPKTNDAGSEIAVIDLRSCIREAMATAIRGNSNRRIITASNAEGLANTSFCSNPSKRQIVLFCDGSLDTDSVGRELLNLRTFSPHAKVAILTDRNPGQTTPETLQIVDGVIPSYYETAQLLACIQVIDSGIKYLPPVAAANESSNATTRISKKASELLTPRQIQVMGYISEGRSNKYIAAELSVSESTIKVHVHEAMKRLGATSRTHAVYILNHG